MRSYLQVMESGVPPRMKREPSESLAVPGYQRLFCRWTLSISSKVPQPWSPQGVYRRRPCKPDLASVDPTSCHSRMDMESRRTAWGIPIATSNHESPVAEETTAATGRKSGMLREGARKGRFTRHRMCWTVSAFRISQRLAITTTMVRAPAKPWVLNDQWKFCASRPKLAHH